MCLWIGFNTISRFHHILLLHLFSEFTALDKQLDELNSVLDALEAKNDDIHGKLKELLESSRQERLQMKGDNAADSSRNDDNNGDGKQPGNSSSTSIQSSS